MLLHDDDLLLPRALEQLSELWKQVPDLDAAFGKQALIEHDGSSIAPERTDVLNASYRRVPANAGRQDVPILAGLTRMFPNDGFMINTALAREIGYRSHVEVGDACDTDFGLRLCAAATNVWYLDEFTAKYRITNESVGKNSMLEPYTYAMLLNLKVPPSAELEVTAAKRKLAMGAVSGFARMSRPRQALKIFLSADYPLSQRIRPRGIYHLMWIAHSYVGSIVRSLFGRPRDG